VKVLEHAFAVLDFATAQPPIVGAVQARRMALESDILCLTEELRAQRKANDHAEDFTCVV
jgi:hypothetical protein